MLCDDIEYYIESDSVAPLTDDLQETVLSVTE